MRLAAGALLLTAALHAAPAFEVKFGAGLRAAPVDGRLIVVVSKELQGPEPRFQVEWGVQTQQVFAVDVDGWKAGEPLKLDGKAAGHPLRALGDLPAGEYRVQAVLNVYETVHMADGRTLKLPWDDGEGQQWESSPGNLVSEPRTVRVGADSVVPLELTRAIPPIEPPKDTKYVRHVRMQSELLTKFWGRPVYIGAHVLVPEGFDEHLERRYPVAYNQGHFPADFRAFRETPPQANLSGPAMQRAQNLHRFYQEWTSGRLPKFLVVLTQHATPYYDDSYGVNSANMGPYGDALTKEFYPWLEKKFRAIGEPWARVLYGGSTGGWMVIAQQIFYPDFFGGAWGFCPDPLDFHTFQLVNVYEDKNAWYDEGPFLKIPRPLGRLPNDHTMTTIEEFSRQETVLGARGRSGGQFDAFHATFGPVGADGYPAPLWNPATGQINPEVARHWREKFDLTSVLKRNWESLGPRLVGKIHVTMGTKDTFYLDAGARRMEEFLESTKLPLKGPYYGGSFVYGNDKPHCWPGPVPEGQTLEMYYLPIFAEHMRKMAPAGADLSSWK
ncbi:MAG: hypothetical protein HY821_22850 [Acidobacteria bacterium]|nr:hypothetical protein [Acidobacteriota bacterium]